MTRVAPPHGTGTWQVLKWLHSAGCAGCPWNSATCHAAAEGGYLEVVKWLHNTGCPSSSGVCYFAARGGQLEVLKWLHNQGYPCGGEYNVSRCRCGRAL